RLDEIIHEYLKEVGAQLADVSAVGLHNPGLVDSASGTNHTFFVDESFNLRDYHSKELDKYVDIINDVNATALNGLIYAPAHNNKNVLVILMDWGIGLGIIADGQVYMGNNGFSGEMGHMVFEEDGELCYCGKRGCLETIASGIYLVNQ